MGCGMAAKYCELIHIVGVCWSTAYVVGSYQKAIKVLKCGHNRVDGIVNRKDWTAFTIPISAFMLWTLGIGHKISFRIGGTL